MAFIKVMRRKDALHVFFPASDAMRARTDVLEEAWLDTETQKTMLELPPITEKPKVQVTPEAPAKRRTVRKKAVAETAASKKPSVFEDDSLESLG